MSESVRKLALGAPAASQHISWMQPFLLLLLMAAFMLRTHELTRQPIWWDEARNLDVALRPLSTIASAPELDIQPPFYYWALHGWLKTIGVTVGEQPARLALVARWLSVAAGLLSTALLYPLGVRLFSPAVGLIAVLIATLSPFWLAESQEARMYTVGFLALTTAAWALVTAIQTQGKALRNYGRFVLVAALAVLTHYNALFILAAWYGWWAAWAMTQPDRVRRLRTLVLCGISMSVLLTPMIPIALRQIPTYANPNLTIPTVTDYLWRNWTAYLGGYAVDSTLLWGGANLWLWISLMVMFLGATLAIHQHARVMRCDVAITQPTQAATFLLVWVFGGLALYYVAVLDRGAFNVRYSSFVTPALYLLMGWGLAALWRQWRVAGAAAVAIVVVGMAPALYGDLYDDRFAREDIAGVTAWLRQHAGPDDLILVDQKYPFGFYYERYSIDPALTPTGPEAAPARYLFVDINTVDQRLNQWAGAARQIFWVQWFESDTDPRRSVPFLLDQAGTYAGSHSFQGYVIDWWQLTPPNHFQLADHFTQLTIRFPPVVETVAVALPAQPVAPGKAAPVVIRWRRTGQDPLDRPYKARVALYDAREARVGQSDERLLNDRHLMPAEWLPDDTPLNVYSVPTPSDLAEGRYTLRLLVYDADTLEALTRVDEAGNPAGQEALLGEVEIRR